MFANSLLRCSMITNNSGVGKYLQYYPVHKFNSMQYAEKKQHSLNIQKASKPIESKYKRYNFSTTPTNQVRTASSNYLVVDDA